MNLPPELKIGGHVYKIVLRDDDFHGADGRTDNKTGTIFIDKTLKDTTQFSTLLHEITHVLNSEIDHALMDSLAEQLFQVLYDNQLLNPTLFNGRSKRF